MQNLQFTDDLTFFGLTRQEAVIYTTLLSHGEMTGYEVSKETGISRSNVYAALSNLADKGAAYLIQGDSTKYLPVDVQTFTSNVLKDLQQKADYIKEQYFLEVSSPGIERVLRKDWQLKKYIENKVQLNLFKKDENGFKEYAGFLKKVEDDYLIILQDEIEYKVQRKNISQIKTVFDE